ncbi:hypothetical protein [Endozoicomonas euniceicola]|uniref:Uncharacterized protein n=1 Tax=Endozoicomonas euniceicola TaxID=1234143 RepID=A0ABY6GNB5_9GAMM|nr:hypothetical protein [Endozoicomonas euniceicola]UYM14223.1 hypothetical protein NX720_15085 [Endozoicomonas euniceicola]
MSFDRTEFDDGYSFYHVPSGNVLTLKRAIDEYWLSLKLVQRGGQEMATAMVSDRFDQSLIERGEVPFGQQCRYTIDSINIDEELRVNTCLDTLMLYIALSEVRANDGHFMYILYPQDEYIGRYFQYAFFPAPISAEFKKKMARSRNDNWPWRQDPAVLLDRIIADTRNRSLFRGSVEVSLSLLRRDVNEFYVGRRANLRRSSALR